MTSVIRARKLLISENNGPLPRIDKSMDYRKSCEYFENVIKNLFPMKYLLSEISLCSWKDNQELFKVCFDEINSQRDQSRLFIQISQLDDYIEMADVTRSIFCDYSKEVFTVEIKPKWGFLSYWPAQKGHEIEASICRFCMHQVMKLKSSTYSVFPENKYCPLDLFSSCKGRIKRALLNLVTYPQNNFRLFVDGEQKKARDFSDIFGMRLADIVSAIIEDDALLNEVHENSPDHQDYCGNSAKLECCRSNSCNKRKTGGIFEFLRKVQMTDILGIYRIFEEYEKMTLDEKKQCSELMLDFKSPIWTQPVASNNSKSKNSQNFDILGDFSRFLVSTTFRDCSIMISFSICLKNQCQSSFPFVIIDGSLFHYSIKLIDLDPRSPSQIPFQMKNHRDIIHSYQTEKGLSPCNCLNKIG